MLVKLSFRRGDTTRCGFIKIPLTVLKNHRRSENVDEPLHGQISDYAVILLNIIWDAIRLLLNSIRGTF